MPYLVQTNGQSIPNDFLTNEIQIKLFPVNATDQTEYEQLAPNIFRMTMRPGDAAKVKALPNVIVWIILIVQIWRQQFLKISEQKLNTHLSKE